MKKVKAITLVKGEDGDLEWKIKGTTIQVGDVMKRAIFDKINEIIKVINER